MTVEELVNNIEFQAFCDIWEKEGRCPEVFQDWLYENCGEGEAEAAKWAYEQPYRSAVTNKKGHVNPTQDEQTYGWSYTMGSGLVYNADIPYAVWDYIRIMKTEGGPSNASTVWVFFYTFSEAIAHFITAWAEVRDQKGVMV